MTERPKVGVGLLIVRGNKILLGKRKGSHGEGEYGGTGGHMEHLESFEETALRELLEEAGPDIKVKNMRFLCITNLTAYAPKHYVDVGMVAEWDSGEPQITEPDKKESWGWYDLDNLPSPFFSVMENYITAYKTGQIYFTD
jgi:8-oxo-dGTP diphosphatase